MKKEDVYLVRGEAIESEGIVITHAIRKGIEIRFGGADGGGWSDSWLRFENPSPALTAFIEEAKAYFRPKKSCGDLSRRDFEGLMTSFALSPDGEYQDQILEKWATSRGIQLPSEEK